MSPILFKNRLWLYPCLLVGLIAILAACQQNSETLAGVSGTGNAGRVIGRVVSNKSESTSGFDVRLLSLESSAAKIVASVTSDSSGGFHFPSTGGGNYLVEVWKAGVLRGDFGPFVVDGDQNVIVLLVDSRPQFSLDLAQLGSIDSAYVDYPGNPAVLVDGKWHFQSLRDTGFVIYAHRASVPVGWEAWVYLVHDGKEVLMGLKDQKAVPFLRTIDSNSYPLTPRTVALWTFDSIDPKGIAPDRSPLGNDLRMPANSRLVASPFGKAYLQDGVEGPVVVGGSVPTRLQWSTTGQMTYECRFRLDSIPQLGQTFFGAYPGVAVYLANDGKVLVGGQATKNASADTIWFTLVSDPGVVAVGRWTNLAISVDANRSQVYAWVDEKPLALTARDAWGDDVKFLGRFTRTFDIGPVRWLSDPGYLRIDEMRISDTLVYGKGYEILPSLGAELDTITGLDALSMVRRGGALEFPAPSDSVWVGKDSATSDVGSYALRFRIPPKLEGKKIVSALFYVWDEMDIADRDMDFSLSQILSSWTGRGFAGDWISPDGNWKAGSLGPQVGSGRLRKGTTGGVVMDVTTLVQGWIAEPASNHGVLLRTVDETGSIGRSLVSSTGSGGEYRVRISVKYR